jgi:hypothetical protein
MKELKVLEAGEKAPHDGLIRHFGFSFHDSHKVLKDIIDGYDGKMSEIGGPERAAGMLVPAHKVGEPPGRTVGYLAASIIAG